MSMLHLNSLEELLPVQVNFNYVTKAERKAAPKNPVTN